MIGKIVDSQSKIARFGAANIYWTGRKFEPEFSSRVSIVIIFYIFATYFYFIH